MFVEERQELIVKELIDKGSVRVKELSERFSVTEDLIRKDLNALEKQGKCKKIYGGAILEKENVHRRTAAQRKSVNIEAKKKIAKTAMDQIKEGSVVFLDISTTVVELARLIVNKNLRITVVTNALEVINLFANTSINTIFIGGEFDYGKDGFVGSMADAVLSNFYFDYAFMGVVAIDMKNNAVYTYMAADGITKQTVLSHSKQAFLLSDLDKFNQIGNYQYAAVSDFDGIITDVQPSAQNLKFAQKYDVKIYYEENKDE